LSRQTLNLAAGFRVGTATAWRYVEETVALPHGRRGRARRYGTRRGPGTPTSSWTGRWSPSTGSPQTGLEVHHPTPLLPLARRSARQGHPRTAAREA